MAGSPSFWPAPPNGKSLWGAALLKAVREDAGDQIALLCQAGADPNVFSCSHGRSLLALAIHQGKDRAAQSLLDAGAHPAFPSLGPLEYQSRVNWFDRYQKDGTNALETSLRARRWVWADRLLDQMAADRDTFSEIRWPSMLTIAVLRGAPNPTLLALEALSRRGPRESWHTRAEWMETALETTSADLLKRLVGLLEKDTASVQDARAQWATAVTRRLSDVPLESDLSGNVKTTVHGAPVAALIRLWLTAAPDSDRCADQVQLKTWTHQAIKKGWAPVLATALLPALDSPPSAWLPDCLQAALLSERNADAILQALNRSAGRPAVRKAWQRLGSDTCWGTWAMRFRHIGFPAQETLVLAQALIDSGVPCPVQVDGKAWFPQVLNVATMFTTGMFQAHEAPQLQAVEALLAHGVDALARDPQGKTVEEALADLPWQLPGFLRLQSVLARHRLENQLPASVAPKRSSRL